jgi:Heparinase II/III-like protein
MGAYDFNFDLPPGETYAPSQERVAALEAILPPGPFGFAPPASDRAAWDRWRGDPFGVRILASAREFAAKPFPAFNDATWLDCLERQDVGPYNAAIGEVRKRQFAFLLAEAIHDRGEFLGAIASDARAVSSVRTWIHPGNDLKRLNFDGKTVEPDLGALHFAANLGETSRILGGRLPAQTLALIAEQADRRVFAPLSRRIISGRDLYWWLAVKHNWNSVCLATCAEAAAALVPSARERAWWLAFAGTLILNARDGYNDDGVCTEGTGYWGYGYEHYVLLAELLRLGTAGTVDLLDDPKMERVSLFADRIEIQPGVFPTYADCPLGAKPLAWARVWTENRVGSAGPAGPRQPAVIDPFESMSQQFAGEALLWMFRTRDPRRPERRVLPPALREWFEPSTLLICRPGAATGRRLSALLRGGNNGTNHHHNDLGTFTVTLDGATLILDPGTEAYSFRTFSTHRFDSQLINSYGHPVPRVAGRLQETGAERRTRLLGKSFTDREDRVLLDLRLAYDVPGLVRLEREFVYDRRGAGSVTVTDTVEFLEPAAFESALISLGKVGIDGNRIHLSSGPAAVVAEVVAEGSQLDFVTDTINQPPHPVRIALRCRGTVRSATIRTVIRPA